jgi:hypothetical protein
MTSGDVTTPPKSFRMKDSISSKETYLVELLHHLGTHKSSGVRAVNPTECVSVWPAQVSKARFLSRDDGR